MSDSEITRTIAEAYVGMLYENKQMDTVKKVKALFTDKQSRNSVDYKMKKDSWEGETFHDFIFKTRSGKTATVSVRPDGSFLLTNNRDTGWGEDSKEETNMGEALKKLETYIWSERFELPAKTTVTKGARSYVSTVRHNSSGPYDR